MVPEVEFGWLAMGGWQPDRALGFSLEFLKMSELKKNVGKPKDFREMSCSECAGGAGLDFEFEMAFQPIVNGNSGEIFAYEALVRGPNGEPSSYAIANVNDGNRYRFDQACRVKAIKTASELGMTTFLSINFMPNAIYRPELCIRTTLAAAEAYCFPFERIIFEVTEAEQVADRGHLKQIVEYYKGKGFTTAIDDFGAGYAGLGLLADFQTDLIKLDMALVRNIDRDLGRRSIVKGVLLICSDLSIGVIAEGIETYEEYVTLKELGVELFQGYYFARPAFRQLACVPRSVFKPS